MQTIDVGETYPFASTWWGADKVGAEPSAITLTIDPPSGAPIVKTKVNLIGTASTDGSATLDTWTWAQVITLAGAWRYEFVGTVGGVEVRQSGLLLAGEGLSKPPGPCEPWATWADVVNTCPNTPQFETLAPGVREQLLDRATGILYSLDGRRYPGICQATRRLCRSCSSCGGSCHCGVRSSIDLGSRWPVYAVWDVTVDGDVLAGTGYQLRDRRFLDRLGGGSWPASADLTDVDAFHLTWAYGRRPPVELRDAAAIFAGEMAKSCLGLACDIPQRVTTVQREGVTYVVLDSQKFLDEGRTGINMVDLALIAARAGRKSGPGAFSPMRSGSSARIG